MIRDNIDLGGIVPQGPVANKTATDIVKNITGGTPVQNKTTQDALDVAKQAEGAVARNAAAKAAADALVKGAAEYLKEHPNDYVPPNEWTLAISSNEDRVTPWGYRHVNFAAEDGTVVLYNAATNEIKNIDEDMRTIYGEQIAEFSRRETEARDKFKKAEEFEKRVAEAEADMDKERSVLDVVCDFVHILTDEAGRTTLEVDKDGKLKSVYDIDRIKDVLSGWTETSWLNRVGISQDINTKEIGDLLYRGETAKALERLNELNVSDRERNMVAYYAAKQQGDMKYALTYTDAIKSMGWEALQNLGRDLDWDQTAVRAIVAVADAKLAEYTGTHFLFDEDTYAFLKDKSLNEAIAAGYEASWVNGGRKTYGFDTGWLPFDMALEICTSPDNIMRWIESAAARSAAKTATQALVDAGFVESTAKRSIKGYIMSGNEVAIDNLVRDIAKAFPGSEDGITAIIKHSLEYSSAYRIAKITGVLRESKDYIDDLVMWASGAKLYGKLFKGIFETVTDITKIASGDKILITAKALTDAIAQVEGKYGDINITDVKEFIDYAKLNMATLSNVERTAVQLSKEEIYEIILDTYRRDYAIAEPNLKANVDRQAMEVLEMNGLMDTPLYQLLQTPGAADICTPLQALVSKGDAEDILTPEFAQLMGTRASEVIDNASNAEFRDITTDSGKIYQAKINRTFEAEHFMRDGFVQAFNEQLLENPADVIRAAKNDAATAHMVANTVAEANYSTVKEHLKQARDMGVFTDEEYTNVLSQLYSPKNISEAKRTFPVSATMTPYQISSRATRLAKDIVDDTFNTEVQLSELSATNMLSFKCNVLDDLDGSVENMAKYYEVQDDVVPMFYFAKFDDRNDLVDLVFRTEAGETLHFTEVKDIDDFIIQHSYEATRSDKTLKIVGFNNHGTGFNTDAHMRNWLQFHNSNATYRFTKTVDIADNIRINRGFIPPTEAQYEAVKGAVLEAHKRWKTYAALSMNNKDVYLPFSMTAPLAKDVDTVVQLAKQGTTLDAGLVASLEARMNDWDEVYHNFNLTGNHATTDFNVAKRFHQDYMGALQVKKVWDAAQNYTVYNKELIDEAVHNGFNSWAATEAADEVYATLMDLRDASIMKLSRVGIDEAWDLALKTATDQNPMRYAKVDTPQEKMAWLLTADKHDEWFVVRNREYYGGDWNKFLRDDDNWKFVHVYRTDRISSKNGVIKVTGYEDHCLGEFLDDEFTLLRKTSNRLTDLEPTLPGRFGNAANNWAVQQEMSDAIRELRASDEGIMAVNQYLRQQGKVSPLIQYTLDSEVELHKVYGQIEDMYNKFIDAQRTSAQEVIRDYQGNKVTLDLYHEFTSDIRGAATNHFNRGLMMWSQQHLTDRVGYITKLDDTDLETYLAKYALGRMYIDTQTIDPITTATLKTRLSNVANEHIAFDEVKGGIRIYLTGMDAPDVRTLPDLVAAPFKTELSPKQVLEQINPRGDKITESMKMTVEAVQEQQDLVYRLAEHNDLSFGYGNFVANSPALYKQVNDKYFADLPLIDFSDAAKHGYECSYFGQIDGLRMEGQFFSSNILVNMANAWTTTCRQQRTINDITTAIFNSGVDGHTMIKRMLDSNTITLEALRGTGYHWIQWDKELGVKELDFHNYDPKKFVPNTAILSKPDFDRYKKMCDKAMSSEELSKLQLVTLGAKELIEAFQSSLISTYLYSNPETGLHNIVDSSLKGVLSEGSDHTSYMFESRYLNSAVDEARKKIVELVKRDYVNRPMPEYIEAKYIDEFFKNGDVKVSGGMLSKRRFLQVLEYHHTGYADPLDTISDILGTSKEVSRFKTKPAQVLEKLNSKVLETKWFKMNRRIFELAEDTNRLAIWLKHMDMGDDFATAASRIAMSQFDYTKNAGMKTLNSMFPFIQFRLNNMCYWFDKGVANKGLMGDLAKMYQYEKGYRHQTAAEQEYRAWLYTLDYTQFAQDEIDAYENYNPITDYRGATVNTAQDNGWISIGDKLYFKIGFSMMDAFTGQEVMLRPFSNTFAPLATILKTAMANIHTPATQEALAIFEAAGAAGVDLKQLMQEFEDKGFVEALEQNYFEIGSLVPILGTVFSRFANMYRNGAYAYENDLDWCTTLLSTLIPGLFVAKRVDDPSKGTYLDRPIGYAWYNQTEEYKSTHRYIAGVSYIPKWVTRSASHYIDTYGRLQLLGMTRDQVEQLFNDGGTFWWTQNNDGAYELHNYKLMIQDEETQTKIYNDLLSFGWTEDQAKRLIEEASIPTWLTHPKKQNNRLPGAYTSLQGYRRYANIHIPYQMMPNQLGSRLRSGKNVMIGSYQVAKPRVQHNQVAKSYVHWHRRERDIYKENYAKYGASRMAMTQNLKNYSNKSIVQLHREEQQQRYARIHRHQHW